MTPEQCRAARALVNMSQDALAKRTGVSKRTIAGFEMGESKPYTRTLDSLSKALENAGVEFIPKNGGGAGVRLKKPNS